MEEQKYLQKDVLEIDSHELLIRFLLKCKNDSRSDNSKATAISSCADLVTAVYYYRRYPNVNDFIEKYLKNKENYFHLQWARTTWAELSKMTESEMSDLVINQIDMVDNSSEEQ